MDALALAISDMKREFSRGMRNFSIEYMSLCGQRWGAVSEWENRLVVQGNGQAKFLRRRGPGDSAQIPPGNYSGTLEASQLLAFLDALDASGIEAFRTPAPGPWDPVSRMQIVLGTKVFNYSWSFANPPVPLPMARLENLLVDWTLSSCPIINWNLIMTIDSIQCRESRFSGRIRLENQGNRGIRIVRPGSPGMEDPFRMELKYGEVQLIREGYTPAPTDTFFSPLRFQPLLQLELVEILPGEPLQLEFISELEGEAPRGREGLVSFLHYLPQDTVAGLEVFNGAVFTEEFAW